MKIKQRKRTVVINKFA